MVSWPSICRIGVQVSWVISRGSFDFPALDPTLTAVRDVALLQSPI